MCEEISQDKYIGIRHELKTKTKLDSANSTKDEGTKSKYCQIQAIRKG